VMVTTTAINNKGATDLKNHHENTQIY
jgi:hypothetical protein